MKPFKLFTAAFLLISTFACSANEGILTYSTAVVGYVNGTGGWSFQPLEDISVTSLGCFDYVLNGQSPVSVGLWNQSGSLLTSTSVTASDPLLDLTRYQSITPITLMAGQTYYLGAYSTSGTLTFAAESPGAGGFATTSPEIQLGTIVVSSSGGFSDPNQVQGDSGSAILAPNFQFVPVPEPSVAALALLSGTVLFWRRLAQNKSSAA